MITVTDSNFHGGRELYSGRSEKQAIRIARRHDCYRAGSCMCGGPTITREDGAVLRDWEAARPLYPADAPVWCNE